MLPLAPAQGAVQRDHVSTLSTSSLPSAPKSPLAPRPLLRASQRPRPPSPCSHLFPWQSHSFALCWGHATGRGSQHKTSVTPTPLPGWPQQHPEVLQGQGWAPPATSLPVSPGGRRMHPVSPSTPTPRGCTQGVTQQGLTTFGLVQSHPVTQQLCLQGQREQGQRGRNAPSLGGRGETP